MKDEERYSVRLKYTPLRPTKLEDLKLRDNCLLAGCYGGFNRAPKGKMCWTVHDLWMQDEECCVGPQNFPGTNPWPLLNLSYRCSKAVSFVSGPGFGEYRFRGVVKVDTAFSIQTQCFCGTGFARFPFTIPDEDGAIGVTKGELYSGGGLSKVCN